MMNKQRRPSTRQQQLQHPSITVLPFQMQPVKHYHPLNKDWDVIEKPGTNPFFKQKRKR